MRTTAFLFFLMQSILLFGQTDTRVYLFDIKKTDDTIQFSNQRNISSQEGYNNQPSFFNDNLVLFASTRNDQTDIAAYNIRDANIKWISDTPNGSEYSPIKIPSKMAVSSIRLDTNGTQLLYQYDLKTGKPQKLIDSLVIGYHTWFNKNTIVSLTIFDNNGLSLVVSDLKKKTNKTITDNIGRSLHKIPNSQLISYISKENRDWEIKSLDPITGVTKKITNTIPGVEDMCWLIDGTILMGKGNTIFKFNPKKDAVWSKAHIFKGKEIHNITRIASNEIGGLLAFVSDVSPEHIVQKQLDAYNNRNIDAFVATYSNDIKIYNYPNQLQYEGVEKLREGYATFFKRTTDLNCEIKNRIVIGNKVIDEEYLTINGENYNAVAIYEVEKGKIAKVTFVK